MQAREPVLVRNYWKRWTVDNCCWVMAGKKSNAMKRCEGYMKAVRKGKKKTSSKKKK